MTTLLTPASGRAAAAARPEAPAPTTATVTLCSISVDDDASSGMLTMQHAKADWSWKQYHNKKMLPKRPCEAIAAIFFCT